jgi:catechol 2,3-dioxygenase-like lactoylglutathione lyase family enzyme
MRIDHIAFRVPDRAATVQFLCDALGYKVQQEFPIYFNEEKTEMAMCTALEPPEKLDAPVPWTTILPGQHQQQYHMPPEIFVSEGTPGSIVHDWVKARGPGIHHIAIQVDSVDETMKEWQRKGWAEFTSEAPMKCEGLTQVFTKPSSLTGVIFEFIERGAFGFCKENVKALMESTKDVGAAIKV